MERDSEEAKNVGDLERARKRILPWRLQKEHSSLSLFLFLNLFLAVQGLSLVAVCGLLIKLPSFVVAHRLSCPLPSRILPDQG